MPDCSKRTLRYARRQKVKDASGMLAGAHSVGKVPSRKLPNPPKRCADTAAAASSKTPSSPLVSSVRRRRGLMALSVPLFEEPRNLRLHHLAHGVARQGFHRGERPGHLIGRENRLRPALQVLERER